MSKKRRKKRAKDLRIKKIKHLRHCAREKGKKASGPGNVKPIPT